MVKRLLSYLMATGLLWFAPSLENHTTAMANSLTSAGFASPETWMLDAINPSLKKIPFPGGRGIDQLVLYDYRSARPRTETNEFGYEVTIVNGRVDHAEGSNSLIPKKGKGYVLSAHGKASRWLLQHAQLGADVSLNEAQHLIHIRTGVHQSEYQLRALLNDLRGVFMPLEKTQTRLLLLQASRLNDAELEQLGTPRITEQLKQLQQKAWQRLGAFKHPAMYAVWLRPEARSRSEIQATLDDLQRAGINTIFMETFVHGQTIYPSTVFEQFGIENTSQYPKYALANEQEADYLQQWIEECHKRKMQYHAWLQLFYVGHSRVTGGAGPILEAKPQWANRMAQYANMAQPQPSVVEQGYYFMDPANPEVRSFHLALVTDLVRRYAVDGVQIDYIRYPASPSPNTGMGQYWGYTPLAREQFKLNYGIDPLKLTPDQPQWKQWLNYKASNVSETVQRIAELLNEEEQRQQRPIPLSADIFPDHKKSMASKQQDWPLWIQEQWLDFICPMTLATTPQSVAEAIKEMRLAGKNPQFPVVAGVFSPFYGSDTHALYLQLNMAQRKGANGFSVFTAANLKPEMKDYMSLWASGLKSD
jgi:uncharacterized lipoprotein YddW (UPF0748 family)